MRRLILAILFLSLWRLPVFAEDTPSTGKLFVTLKYDYTYRVKHFAWSDTWDLGQQQILGKGSFWSIEAPNGIILVTAAHVLGANWKPQKLGGHDVDEKDCFITKFASRALIGTLGYEPAAVGFAKDLNDAGFLRPKDPGILKTIKALPLSDTPPTYGENVQVVGYPGTPFEQFSNMSVTAVHEDDHFFVLNQAVDDGYSGGVVLSSAGKAYGVIVNTDAGHKQTTVLS